jgi:hypothetical protein
MGRLGLGRRHQSNSYSWPAKQPAGQSSVARVSNAAISLPTFLGSLIRGPTFRPRPS